MSGSAPQSRGLIELRPEEDGRGGEGEGMGGQGRGSGGKDQRRGRGGDEVKIMYITLPHAFSLLHNVCTRYTDGCTSYLLHGERIGHF